LPAEALHRLLRAPPDGLLELVPVGARVNAAANEGPELLEPVALDERDTGVPGETKSLFG
jgi:putative SOS response-associated peptidase YedK